MSRKKIVLTNMLWRFAERCGAQGVSFVVSLVLARLLTPEDYGVVSLITIFTSILTLFIDSGFKNALIQKKNADQLDFTTVFYFNVFLGAVLYFVMFAASPLIADFFGRPDMVAFIRVMSLTLLLGGINGVQTAIVSKRMEFRKFFYSTLAGTIFSAMVGVAMAYKGAGVWALIFQRLLNQAIDTGVLWCTVRWRPSLEFSFRRLRPMFAYGSRILGSSLLNSFTSNLSGLLIGKIYESEMLAYYEKGRTIPGMLTDNLQISVQSVLFPVMALEQDKAEQVKDILKRSIGISTYFVFPFMIGIASCAEPLIQILYTEKWIQMVPYLQLWCFSSMFYLWHTANLQVIQAMGRSDIFLRIEAVKQFLALAGVFLAIPFGVLTLLMSVCVTTVISLAINAHPNQKLVNYGFLKQVRDMFPILALNGLLAAVLWLTGRLPFTGLTMIFTKAAVGIAFYIAGSLVMKLSVLRYAVGLLLELAGRGERKEC